MDFIATSEAYDHEDTAPAVVEIPEPQRSGESDNKFQKAITVWRGM
jgi:vacuolar-type H+-ATPase subunit F/Vma7